MQLPAVYGSNKMATGRLMPCCFKLPPPIICIKKKPTSAYDGNKLVWNVFSITWVKFCWTDKTSLKVKAYHLYKLITTECLPRQYYSIFIITTREGQAHSLPTHSPAYKEISQMSIWKSQGKWECIAHLIKYPNTSSPKLPWIPKQNNTRINRSTHKTSCHRNYFLICQILKC